MFRFTKYKRHTPFDVVIRAPDGQYRLQKGSRVKLSQSARSDDEPTGR